MASRSANITFDILAKDNASKVFDKMTDKIDNQERALKGLRIAGTAQFIALAAAAGFLAKNSIDAGRDLVETTNMASVVFGNQADEMITWADTADRTVGLSKQAALEATATFGDMFTQLQFSGDEAASLSQSTVQLAADLGSFRNLPTEDVLLRIQGAMRGEYDSLKLLIPNISAARIESEALATTGKSVASELTAQEKVAATLAVINKDASNATGDFARTSGDLANQQKIVAAASENMTAELGEQLLPAVLTLTSAGLSALDWMDDHHGATVAIAIAVGTLSAAIAVAANWQAISTTATTIAAGAEWAWTAAKTVSNTVLGRSIPLKTADTVATNAAIAASITLTATTAANTAITAANTAANKANTTSFSKLGKVIGPVGAALAVMVASSKIPEWGTETVEGASEVTSALLDIAEGADITKTSIGKMIDRGGFKDWFTGNDVDSLERAYAVLKDTSVEDQIDNVISSVVTFGQATSTSRTQSEELFATLDEGLSSLVQSGNADEAATAIENLGFKYEDVKDFLPAYTDALADAENQTRLAADSTDEQTDSTEELTDATEDAGDKVKSFNDLLSEQITLQADIAGVALDSRAALSSYEQSVDDATDAVKENGRTLDLNTQKGRDNDAALRGIAESALTFRDAQNDAGTSVKGMNEDMSTQRDAFIKTATRMGATKKEANKLADAYGLIPTKVDTTIVLKGYADTYQSLKRIQDQLRSTTGNKNLRIAMGTQGGTTKYAGGGPIVGPGTGTSDDVLVSASNGEFMQTAAAHNFWGTNTMTAMNNMDVAGVFAGLSMGSFAGGGQLGASSYSGAAMGSPYRSNVMAAPGSGAMPSTVNLTFVDRDGQLIATMQGVVDASLQDHDSNRVSMMTAGAR